MSYDQEELVAGKKRIIPWKSKIKGIEYWKAINIDKWEGS